MVLHDAHCHLDFMANGEDVARDACKEGAVLFANTVTPGQWAHVRERFGAFGNVRVGLGLHPWWVRSGEEARHLVEQLDEATHIGEVGLDFGPKHVDTREDQVYAFSQIARACGAAGGKVISIHSVKAAREVLDELQAGGALDTCTCIFHWYSGPSDQLKRAIDSGCYFSVNTRMLATRKGREYAKAIPANRLLLETDAPPRQDMVYSWNELSEELLSVAGAINQIKASDIANTLERNTRAIL